MVFVTKPLKFTRYFSGVNGSYRTASGLLQPHSGKSNKGCSQIYDLGKGETLMWLAVNKSVLNLIWILSGYKGLKWKWGLYPWGACELSANPYSNNCWFCIHIIFWYHYLLNLTLTLCSDSVNCCICFISTAIKEVLEPRVVFNQEDEKRRHAEQNKADYESPFVCASFFFLSFPASSSTLSSFPQEVEHDTSGLDIVLIHCQNSRTPTG